MGDRHWARSFYAEVWSFDALEDGEGAGRGAYGDGGVEKGAGGVAAAERVTRVKRRRRRDLKVEGNIL